MKQKIQEDFNVFVGDLLSCYKEFYCWYHLSRSINKTHSGCLVFFEVTSSSLCKSALSGLARIFEKKNSRSPDVLSIYYLLDIQFTDFEKTIEKLKIVRDKFLMHSEINPARNRKKFIEDVGLTPKMVEDLFDKTIEVTNQIRLNYGLQGEIVYLFEDAKIKVGQEVKTLLSQKQKS